MRGGGRRAVHGTIFNIQRFSIHDGPGIRTTVFLKGCSLRCFWCHNPEGLRAAPQIELHPDRCISCGACLAACEQGAISRDGNALTFRRDLCTACGRCVDTCYAGARLLVGSEMSVEQVVEEVLRDRAFYATSGGGATLSGGEPLLQREFSVALLRRLREESVHTAIETAANVPWQAMAEALPVTDLFLVDLKLIDPAKHCKATGVSNNRILANVRRLAGSGKPIAFRVPVVPTVNDTPEEIAAIADFVAALNAETAPSEPFCLELLAFHRLASEKYRSLGLDNPAAGLLPPPCERMSELADIARRRGIGVAAR
jgi:pyruvate formate lyase activating enzyme